MRTELVAMHERKAAHGARGGGGSVLMYAAPAVMSALAGRLVQPGLRRLCYVRDPNVHAGSTESRMSYVTAVR